MMLGGEVEVFYDTEAFMLFRLRKPMNAAVHLKDPLPQHVAEKLQTAIF